jgi:hypothetical protein
MYLVLTLNGVEVGRSLLLPNCRLSKEMEELRNQFAAEIQQSGTEPGFYIDTTSTEKSNIKNQLHSNGH